jgi:putative hemolysin
MIPLILFLLACAAVYVGTIQAAFSALMRLSLRLLAERSGGSSELGRYLEDPVLLFVPTRVLLGMVVALTVPLFARVIGVEGARHFGLLVLAVASFGGTCEFLVPSLIVRRDPERVLDVLLPGFTVICRPLEPVTSMLVGLVSGSRRERATASDAGPAESAAENGGAEPAPADAGGAQGLIEQEERRLLQSIVDFGDTLVREVMTPRPDIVAIPSDATLDELRALFREQEYSRIPVFKDSLDNILGFVFVKDLIRLVGTDGSQHPLTGLMRPAYFVPETKKVSELLKEFQRQQVQSAIVVDEYGGTAGLVTLEDLLEEIVGEIRDEYDVESEPIVDEGNGSFVFSGKVDVDEVAERLDVRIEREGFETVGGYLLSHLGRVPVVGERFEVDGLSVQVVEAERRRIHKVRIRRVQPALAAGGNERE